MNGIQLNINFLLQAIGHINFFFFEQENIAVSRKSLTVVRQIRIFLSEITPHSLMDHMGFRRSNLGWPLTRQMLNWLCYPFKFWIEILKEKRGNRVFLPASTIITTGQTISYVLFGSTSSLLFSMALDSSQSNFFHSHLKNCQKHIFC